MIKVLIVDDEPEISGLISTRLRRESPDFQIAEVRSAAKCLEYLQSGEVDCILSDYQMPGMNGIELLDAIRDSGEEVPFIFVTGQGNEQVARDAFKKGANDYFTKDAGFAHFTRIINSIVQAVRQKSEEKRRRQAERHLLELNEELEQRVKDETAELAEKNAELERLNRLFVGRDLRMVELKERIRELEGIANADNKGAGS